MNRTWTDVVRRVIVILFTMIAGIGIYLFNATTIVGNPMPMPFGVGAAVVLSGSMEPVLSVNDLVLVKEQDAYEVGDVVIYQENDYLVIHRIVSFDGNMVYAKGDANNGIDDPVDISCIKGEMIGCIPEVGNIVQAVKTPIGIFIILIAAFLLLESSFRKDQKKDDEELDELKEEIRKLRKELEK